MCLPCTAIRWSVLTQPPNNALQRTEAGGRLFYEIRVLRRQPPSLSLSPLDDQTDNLGVHITRRFGKVRVTTYSGGVVRLQNYQFSSLYQSR